MVLRIWSFVLVEPEPGRSLSPRWAETGISSTFACFSTANKASAAAVVVHSAQLDRQLMATRVAVAHEVLGAGIDVLLPHLSCATHLW